MIRGDSVFILQGGIMKNFKLIIMVALVLMFSSHKVFAGDDWLSSGLSSLRNQVSSGISGLSRGDVGGVATGIYNFGASSAAGAANIVVTGAANAASYANAVWAANSYLFTNSLNNNKFSLGGAGSITGLGTGFDNLSLQASQLKSVINSGVKSNISASAGSSKIAVPVGVGSRIPPPSAQKVQAMKSAQMKASLYKPVTW
jgi:hypothetical protein